MNSSFWNQGGTIRVVTKIFVVLLISVIQLSSWALADSCDSDEFVFQYYDLFECKRGGAPRSCNVIPYGTILPLAGGIAGYLLSSSFAKKTGQGMSDFAERMFYGHASQTRKAKEVSKQIGYIKESFREIFSKISSGQLSEKEAKEAFENALKQTRKNLISDGGNKEDVANLSRLLDELQASIISFVNGGMKNGKVASTQVDVRLSQADSIIISRNNLAGDRWATRARLVGRAAVRGSLTLVVGAAGVPLFDIYQKNRLFKKCATNREWYSERSDSTELREFIEIENNCAILPKKSKLEEIFEMNKGQRTEFFRKCPLCCSFMLNHRQEMISDINAKIPTVIVSEKDCQEDAIKAEIVYKGHHYMHRYQKQSDDSYQMTTNLITTRTEPKKNEKMSISITREGTFSNPVIDNVHGGNIISSFSTDQTAVNMTKWYDSLPDVDRIGPPTGPDQLADLARVKYSVAEQIAAANLSIKSILTYCDDVKAKRSSYPAPSPTSAR